MLQRSGAIPGEQQRAAEISMCLGRVWVGLDSHAERSDCSRQVVAAGVGDAEIEPRFGGELCVGFDIREEGFSLGRPALL